MEHNTAEQKLKFLPILLSCIALITVWAIVGATFSSQFSLEYYIDVNSLVVIFAVVVPIQFVLTTKCRVSWSEIWLSLGVPLGLLWSLLGTRGMVLNMEDFDSDVIYGATAIALLTVLYGGLVSAFGFFGMQNGKTGASLKRLPTPYFSFCIAKDIRKRKVPLG